MAGGSGLRAAALAGMVLVTFEEPEAHKEL